MGWLRGNLIVAVGALLMCGAAVAQSTQPASPAYQGKYEERAIRRADRAVESSAPASQPAESFSAGQLELPRVGLALAIVLSLVFVLRWAGKRFFPGAAVPRSGGAMKVLSRLVISPKQQFLMIQVGRRIVVVGDSAGQMSAVSEIADPDEVASLVGQISEEKSQQASKGFGALFHRAEKTFEEKMEPEDAGRERADSPSADDPAVADARGEIGELADKVRLLSAQLRRQA